MSLWTDVMNISDEFQFITVILLLLIIIILNSQVVPSLAKSVSSPEGQPGCVLCPGIVQHSILPGVSLSQ
jgi:hypothetical protein